MTDKQLAVAICVGALFVIGLLIFIISKASKSSGGFEAVEMLMEIGVVVLDVLSSILSGL